MPISTATAKPTDASTGPARVLGASRWYKDHTSSAKNGKPRNPISGISNTLACSRKGTV